MTAVEIYRPGELATAAAPPPSGPLDGWIAVADQVVRLAETICSSPFVPDGLRGSVPATAAAILAGRELGIPPMTALANVHVIKGKTGISALLMRALIQAQGHDWEDVDVTDTRAVVRARRKGETEWTQAAFTADQAKLARIDLGGYPQDKLYARATARLARRKFADVIAGMPYSAEELDDDIPAGAVLAGESYKDERASEPAKPAQRTARRRQAEPKPDPTPARQQATASPSHGPATADLPPLPGEDESPASPDTEREPEESADRPARASSGQVGIIARHFQRLGFTEDEREQRLAITATVAGTDRTLASTKELTQPEAMAVADTLSRCKDRDALIAILASGEAPHG
jgi:hypothetical protein